MSPPYCHLDVIVHVERSTSSHSVILMETAATQQLYNKVPKQLIETAATTIRQQLILSAASSISCSCPKLTLRQDPIRTFIGREKYDRPLWAIEALENPSVTVQGMQMLSTSELSIKWLLKGRPKNPVFAILGGDLILQVTSRFTLNQISGQVIEHDEFWDLSASSVVGQSYFWISRRLYSTIEAGKDTIDAVKSMANGISSEKENKEIFPDLSGDPTKFFQRDDGLQSDAYQIALLLAVIYFVVQFLKATL